MKMVYYFGDKYYNESGTIMSSLYTEKGERYDWGFLRRDVENGEDVVVRKATSDMIKWADNMLETFKE
jgi:hypothetical protein